jgi:hypothetical protein
MKYILTNIPNFILNDDYDFINLNKTEKDLHPVKLMGKNAGNCMFWESTKKIIQNQTSCELLHFRTFDENKENYIDKIESVVLVLANNINSASYTQLNVYHNIIKDLNCKKYLFSIGAQNDTLDMRKFTEHEIVLYNKFLPCFEYAYLRGQYTYDLLKYNEMPLNNVKVVGCPSILLKPIDTDNIKEKFRKLKNKSNDEIKVGINFPQKNQHEKLYESFKSIMSNKDVYTLAVDGLGWYNFINHGKKLKIKNADKLEKNKDNFKFSNNVFKSMDFFADKSDFMFGTRIHGTILGLCAGLPSMCIAIDSRTYELCEQMNIPYVNCINEPIDFKSKNELIEIFKNNFDVSKLDLLKKTISDNKKLYKI